MSQAHSFKPEWLPWIFLKAIVLCEPLVNFFLLLSTHFLRPPLFGNSLSRFLLDNCFFPMYRLFLGLSIKLPCSSLARETASDPNKTDLIIILGTLNIEFSDACMKRWLELVFCVVTLTVDQILLIGSLLTSFFWAWLFSSFFNSLSDPVSSQKSCFA